MRASTSALRFLGASALPGRPALRHFPLPVSHTSAAGYGPRPSRQASSSSFRDRSRDDFPLKPPPISARLRPLVPFFVYWCVITSLAVHLLRTRIQSKEELDKAQAQVSVLEGLIERYRQGERVGPDDIRRELEMVGLRERKLTKPEEGEGGDVGWMKAIFGRRGVQDDEAKADEEAVEQWTRVVNEATSASTSPASDPSLPQPSTPQRSGSSRRAPSATVYM